MPNVDDRNLEFMEQLAIKMQNNFNKYGSTVELEFILVVIVEDELVPEFAVEMNEC